jgi:hypothetical protein
MACAVHLMWQRLNLCANRDAATSGVVVSPPRYGTNPMDDLRFSSTGTELGLV